MSKPVKHIELSHSEWDRLKLKLVQEYGPSILISWKMGRELGFTVREHSRGFVEFREAHKMQAVENDWRDAQSIICLDFYDEAMKSWYFLKYE